jgi:hypothetical protein
MKSGISALRTAAVALAGLLLFAPSLLAQDVNPGALGFEAVPPNTSPEKTMIFINVGTTPLTVAVSLTGPQFAIAENRCANGVKPNTHCNVYLTYTPLSVGARDKGTLSINYGVGVATVALSGQGVASIQTSAKLAPASRQCLKVHIGDPFNMEGKVSVDDKFYGPPTGESVDFTCTNGQETVDLGSATLQYCERPNHCNGGPLDIAFDGFTPDQTGNWSCTMTYSGDGLLGPTSATRDFIVSEQYEKRRCGP